MQESQIHRRGWLVAGLTVTVGLVPVTEIVRVINSYRVGGMTFTDSINFRDAIPDTVPYGSWLKVYYEGTDAGFDFSQCQDLLNKCFTYQMRYEAVSNKVSSFHDMSSWLPFDPVDTNPIGATDSMSINIGSAEYTIWARTTGISGTPDPTPPSFDIIGNFCPTLDSFGIENYDGNTIADGDTINFDWWAPVDSGNTVIDGTRLMKTKTFSFVIRGTGHDHPRERDGSGVKSWQYRFLRTDNGQEDFLAKSGTWADGLLPNELIDTFTFIAVYPDSDVVGDSLFVQAPPKWHQTTYDFSVQGRDLTVLEVFEQKMFFDGGPQLVNQHFVGELARRTEENKMRIHIRLVR